MARLNEAILNNAYARGKSTMTDLSYGGMNGYAPNLAEFVSNQNYVRKQLVCLLIEAPRGFQLLPEPQYWVSALKTLVELHPLSIDGFQSGLEVAVSETAVSGGGEMQQDPINVTRARSTPSFNFVDKYGRPIQNFLHEWIVNLIGDPDSKVPAIATIGGQRPTDLLADMYSATMLFYEPDPSHTKVHKAWLTANMFPKGTGEVVGKRDLTTDAETSQFTIDFTGISQTGPGVLAFAQKILDNTNMQYANPNLRPAFVQNIAADVSAITGRGYKAGVEDLGSKAIRA